MRVSDESWKRMSPSTFGMSFPLIFHLDLLIAKSRIFEGKKWPLPTENLVTKKRSSLKRGGLEIINVVFSAINPSAIPWIIFWYFRDRVMCPKKMPLSPKNIQCDEICPCAKFLLTFNKPFSLEKKKGLTSWALIFIARKIEKPNDHCITESETEILLFPLCRFSLFSRRCCEPIN